MHKPDSAYATLDGHGEVDDLDLTPDEPHPAAAGAGSRWRTGLLVFLMLTVFAGAAYQGNEVFLDRAAQHHLDLAKRAQFNAAPDLERAAAEYKLALVARPEMGEAHYHLGHLSLREHDKKSARAHFAAALRDVEGLPAALRPDALRMLVELDNDREPAALSRTLDVLAVNLAASAPSSTALLIPTEPTAAGLPGPLRKPGRKADIVAAAAEAERAALAAQRPEPSPDFLFADGAPAIAALARRVPASSDVQREVASRLDALYADDALVRLASASALAIAPALSSDAVPSAVERAEAGLLHQRNTPAVADATRATLSLLQSASPLTLALNRQAILRLIDAANQLGPDARQAGMQLQQRLAGITSVPRPVVYIQIANEAQRPVAMLLATQLAEAGWLAPEFELVGERAPARTEVRSQGSSHQGLARWMRRLASEATGMSADLSNLRRATPAGDVYELWLDKDLCLAPNRQVPGCPG